MHSLRTSLRPAFVVGVLGLTLFALVADARRVRTGDLLIQSDTENALVTITKSGRHVTGPTQKRSFTMPPGQYAVEANGLPAVSVTIVRGQRAVVKIGAKPNAP